MSQEKVIWVLFLLATWKLRKSSWESVHVSVYFDRSVALKWIVSIHRHMILKLALPVSDPHRRIAAVAVRNKKGKAAIYSKDKYYF